MATACGTWILFLTAALIATVSQLSRMTVRLSRQLGVQVSSQRAAGRHAASLWADSRQPVMRKRRNAAAVVSA